ncbi:hypothetical protein OROGR_011821 [Orobanche gracilis]
MLSRLIAAVTRDSHSPSRGRGAQLPSQRACTVSFPARPLLRFSGCSSEGGVSEILPVPRARRTKVERSPAGMIRVLTDVSWCTDYNEWAICGCIAIATDDRAWELVALHTRALGGYSSANDRVAHGGPTDAIDCSSLGEMQAICEGVIFYIEHVLPRLKPGQAQVVVVENDNESCIG